MKKKIKKNQVIIAVMALALGVAGYINFSGNSLDLADNGAGDDNKNVTEAMVSTEHIALEETGYVPGEVFTAEEPDGKEGEPNSSENGIELNSPENEIGEAVLTSTGTYSDSMITARLNREQARSRSQEAYLSVINGEITDTISVEDATAAYLELTENMGKEADAETVLAANGFPGAVVSIGENSVDVLVDAESLDDTARAQLEDIVIRKTGCTVDQIVITCVRQQIPTTEGSTETGSNNGEADTESVNNEIIE